MDMEDKLLATIEHQHPTGDLHVEQTLKRARSAVEFLAKVVANLTRVQELNLEVGDLVETDMGGGIVRQIDPEGILIDFPQGQQSFSAHYFSASGVRKPTPQEKLHSDLEAVVRANIGDGVVNVDEAIQVLVDLSRSLE